MRRKKKAKSSKVKARKLRPARKAKARKAPKARKAVKKVAAKRRMPKALRKYSLRLGVASKHPHKGRRNRWSLRINPAKAKAKADDTIHATADAKGHFQDQKSGMYGFGMRMKRSEYKPIDPVSGKPFSLKAKKYKGIERRNIKSNSQLKEVTDKYVAEREKVNAFIAANAPGYYKTRSAYSAGRRSYNVGGLLPNPGRKMARKKFRKPAKMAFRRLHRNPSLESIKSTMLMAAPIVAGVLVSRVATKQIAGMVIPRLPASLAGYSQYAGPVLAIGALVGADLVTARIPAAAPYRTGLLAGMMVSALESALTAILPDNIKAQIGLGDYVQLQGGNSVYARAAMSDYVQLQGMGGLNAEMGGLEADMGDYVTLQGVEQDLAGYRDAGGPMGSGIGSNRLLSPVPVASGVAAVPAVSYTAPVGGAMYDEDDLYTGVFSA